MIGELLLLSGNDLPFPEARVTVHPPTLKEIAYIGEESFFVGCGFLDFSKKMLNDLDKERLSNYDDFDIFMSIMTNSSKDVRTSVEAAKLVLNLIFPLYSVSVRDSAIILERDGQEFSINKSNFDKFKEIISAMFNLKLGAAASEQYNPAGDLAKRIADKFKKRHETLNKLAANKPGDKRIAILSRYASILAVGLQKNLKDLMQYTVYQLYDEFQRFQLKVQWDAHMQARMAGAQNLEEVDNWMIDLQEQGKTKTKNKK